MPDKTFKLIEIVGVSEESIQQAVRNALTKARRTIRNIDWFEVTGIRGAVRPNGDPEFQVQVKIGFRLEEHPVEELKARRAPRGRSAIRKPARRRRPAS